MKKRRINYYISVPELWWSCKHQKWIDAADEIQNLQCGLSSHRRVKTFSKAEKIAKALADKGFIVSLERNIDRKLKRRTTLWEYRTKKFLVNSP